MDDDRHELEITDSAVVVRPIGLTEVVAFGQPDQLDLLGTSIGKVQHPFVDAVRIALSATPQLQSTVEGMTGGVLRLTANGAKLLSSNESMKTSVITGVVRNPNTGKIAGQLTFVDPTSIAGLVSSLPTIASGALMQFQLVRIEKSLDGIKQDLGYLIRNEHLKIEAGLETRLEILSDVHSVASGRGSVEDDQWDRVANIEASVRDLHRLTGKHLRTLTDALDGDGQPLRVRVAILSGALRDEKTLLWLRAHVHAELALARWDAIYLLRQAEQHPEELEQLVTKMQRDIRDRQLLLANLARRIQRYLGEAGAVTSWADRLRLIRRAKLASLLTELDELLSVYRRDLAVFDIAEAVTPIPLSTGSAERTAWDQLVAGARGLPEAATPIFRTIARQVPRITITRQRDRPEQ